MQQQPNFKLTPIAAAVATAMTPTVTIAAEGDRVLETVVGTARKRVESVQDIPSSIQAFSDKLFSGTYP